MRTVVVSMMRSFWDGRFTVTLGGPKGSLSRDRPSVDGIAAFPFAKPGLCFGGQVAGMTDLSLINYQSASGKVSLFHLVGVTLLTSSVAS